MILQTPLTYFPYPHHLFPYSNLCHQPPHPPALSPFSLSLTLKMRDDIPCIIFLGCVVLSSGCYPFLSR
jgi:hypothetical protein